jgi:hypothetical protein
MPQNWRGRFFSMSGSSNCIYALLDLHSTINFCSAAMVYIWCLPYFFRARLYARLDNEHFVENHGARCLSHLFGLVNSRWPDVTSSTPARVAWSSKNCSARADLVSFGIVSSSTMALKAAANSAVDVRSLHTLALVPYVSIQSPASHLYRRDVVCAVAVGRVVASSYALPC